MHLVITQAIACCERRQVQFVQPASGPPSTGLRVTGNPAMFARA